MHNCSKGKSRSDAMIDTSIQLPLSPSAFEKNKSKFEKTLNLKKIKLVVLTNMTSRVLLQILFFMLG
jgi:hypothetical protein